MGNSNHEESAVKGRKGVSILLPGICAVDAIAVCFFIPSLIAPCYLAQFSPKSYKSLRQLNGKP